MTVLPEGPGGLPEGLVEAVDALFPGRRELAARFVGHLASTGTERGLIGPRELPRLWDRHLLNCAAVAELIPQGVALADVGSGAGLPGVVLGIARPDLRITLVEPLLRRTVWLTEVVADLQLDAVTVHRGRAEEWSGEGFAVVTARAVAELGRLWGWCLPLLQPGGRLLALKGESAEEELAAVQESLPGLAGAEVVQCGRGFLDRPSVVVTLTRDSRPVSGAKVRSRAKVDRLGDGSRTGPRTH